MALTLVEKLSAIQSIIGIVSQIRTVVQPIPANKGLAPADKRIQPKRVNDKKLK